MKLLLTSLLILCLQITFAQNAEFSEHRLIFSLNNSQTVSSTDELVSLNDLNFLSDDLEIRKIKLLDRALSKSDIINNRPILIEFEQRIDVITVIERLKNTNLFSYVEPDFINYGSGTEGTSDLSHKTGLKKPSPTTTPNDALFSRQWGLNNDGTFSLSPATADADIDMVEAWDFTTGNPNLIMAIIDSGLRLSHPEFSGRLWENSEEIINGSDSDANGYIDDVDGWDFVNDDNLPIDDHGHGTNVAGIATATGNNGIGYAGVDWSCQVMALKVLDNNGSGLNSNIIESFYYAISKGVKIISISIGGSGFSTAYQTAVNAAYDSGIITVACMMNFNNAVPYYPAAFANTIAVGSTDPNDIRTEPFFWSNTSGSNYGPHIDVVAPGNYMYGLSSSSDTNYNSYWGGTSQATPLVSGICSLMLSLSPNLSFEDIREIIRETAEDQVGGAQDTIGWDQYYGAGRVNAQDALQQVLSVDDYDFDSIKIYPNPVMENLFIASSNISAYTITNISGQLVTKGELSESDKSINCSSLSQGMYFVTLISDSGDSEIMKFMKQ